jgi:type II secretory pathway pseudopilin PulG
MMMRQARKAFMLADALLAIAILSTMAIVLISAMSNDRRSAERLANSRAATRFAEQTLIELRQGHKAPTAPDQMHVTIAPADGAAVPGLQWTKVTVRKGNETAMLFGLARASGKDHP